jgi:hypothetical protein
LKGQLLQLNIEKVIISQTLKGQLLQLNIERTIITILQSNIENAIITVKQWKNNYYSQTLKKQLLQSNIERAIITVKHWKGNYSFTTKMMISIFPLWTFHLNAAPAYGVYISQLIRYSRACGSYPDFLDRGLLLTRVPLG